MENAAQALKMAAFLLIFVVSLTTTILSFSKVRETAQTILEYSDREYDYTYVDDQNGQTERIVSAETIVPAIMRAYKENLADDAQRERFVEYILYGKKQDAYRNEFNNINLRNGPLYDIIKTGSFVEYLGE